MSLVCIVVSFSEHIVYYIIIIIIIIIITSSVLQILSTICAHAKYVSEIA